MVNCVLKLKPACMQWHFTFYVLLSLLILLLCLLNICFLFVFIINNWVLLIQLLLTSCYYFLYLVCACMETLQGYSFMEIIKQTTHTFSLFLSFTHTYTYISLAQYQLLPYESLQVYWVYLLRLWPNHISSTVFIPLSLSLPWPLVSWHASQFPAP